MPDKLRYYCLETLDSLKTFTQLNYLPKEDEPSATRRRLTRATVHAITAVAASIVFYVFVPSGTLHNPFEAALCAAEVFGVFFAAVIVLEWCGRVYARHLLKGGDKEKEPAAEAWDGSDLKDLPLTEVLRKTSAHIAEDTRKIWAEAAEELNPEPLTEEEAEEADILLNAESAGVEFNFATGEITEIGMFKKRQKLGELAEVAGFRYRDSGGPLHSYDYIIVWKDRTRRVLPFSPMVTTPEQIRIYGEKIVPRLKTRMEEFRKKHPETMTATTTATTTASAAENVPPAATRLFRFNGEAYERRYVYEPLGIAVVFVGLIVWLALSSYGWPGTGILAALTLLSGYLLYGEDKMLVISPRTRMIAVYDGFGEGVREYRFEEFDRFVIRNHGPVKFAAMQMKDGTMPLALTSTFDMRRAMAAIRETCGIMNLNMDETLIVE